MSTDCLAALGGNRWFDGGNLAVANGYVQFRGNVVFRIEDLAVAKNEIVLLSVPRDSTGEESGGQDANHWLGVYAMHCGGFFGLSTEELLVSGARFPGPPFFVTMRRSHPR